jgi:hypothetical protein
MFSVGWLRKCQTFKGAGFHNSIDVQVWAAEFQKSHSGAGAWYYTPTYIIRSIYPTQKVQPLACWDLTASTLRASPIPAKLLYLTLRRPAKPNGRPQVPYLRGVLRSMFLMRPYCGKSNCLSATLVRSSCERPQGTSTAAKRQPSVQQRVSTQFNRDCLHSETFQTQRGRKHTL